MRRAEAAMVERDESVKAKAKARNDLEALIFARKDNLSDPKFVSCFDSVDNKNRYQEKLNEVGLWLEDTVGDASISLEEYHARTSELTALGIEAVPKLLERLSEIEREREKEKQEAFIKATITAATGSSHAHDDKKKPKSNKQKLEAAAEAKESGNKHFVDLNFPDAVRRYTQALEHTMSMYDANEEQQNEAKQIKLLCYLNLAQCYLKIEAHAKCIENAKSALEIDSENSKALFRRAQSYFATKEYELAKKDLDRALKVMPTSKDIKSLQLKVQKAIDGEKAKQKKVFAAMFGGGGGETSSAEEKK